jgi:hypothetical protein
MAATQKSARRRKSEVPDLPAIAAAVAALRQLGRPLRASEAAFYLTEGCGVPTSVGHLANLRVNGGGPKFQYAGKWPLYNLTALDVHAKKVIGPEQASTSSRRAA